MGILNVVNQLMGNVPAQEHEKPPQNMNEVIDELPKSYHDYASKELPYRRASAIAFIIICLVCGTPLWWLTTDVYRAQMKNVRNEVEKIELKVNVDLIPTDEKTRTTLPLLIEPVLVKLNEGDVPVALHINWNLVKGELRSLTSIENDVSKPSESLNIKLALVSEDKWLHFSVNYAYLTCGAWAKVKINDDIQKTANRIGTLIWEVLIDIPHLESIVKRDLREKMPPWQISTLPLSHQKRLVWDSAALSGEYIVQVVFLHNNAEKGTDEERKRWYETMNNMWRFAHLVKNVTKLQISSEHLWDFEISNYLQKDVQERWTLTQGGMHKVLKEVDIQLQTVESAAPVLKMIVLEAENPVVVLDAQSDDSRGVAVAAWGSVIVRNEETDTKLIAALRILLGLDSDLDGGKLSEGCPLSVWEITRLKLRAYLDNRLRAASAIRALHKMVRSIDNIVISDDVASLVNQAVDAVAESQIDPNAPNLKRVADARMKADAAVSDPSLLALLYFPSDQKVAVYLPIMVPILIPLAGSVLAIFKWIIGRG